MIVLNKSSWPKRAVVSAGVAAVVSGLFTGCTDGSSGAAPPSAESPTSSVAPGKAGEKSPKAVGGKKDLMEGIPKKER